MTHRDKCIGHCFDCLNQLGSGFAFNIELFNHYYRKHNGAQGNAYSIGLNSADLMIREFNTKKQEVKNDRRNEIETTRAF